MKNLIQELTEEELKEMEELAHKYRKWSNSQLANSSNVECLAVYLFRIEKEKETFDKRYGL